MFIGQPLKCIEENKDSEGGSDSIPVNEEKSKTRSKSADDNTEQSQHTMSASVFTYNNKIQREHKTM